MTKCRTETMSSFFSYTQPQQTGEVLNMWSDADALAKVNSVYFRTSL